MSKDNQLADGFFFTEPRNGAPDYVLGTISLQMDNFTRWVETQELNEKGYIKIDILRSKGGKTYGKVNTWKPDKQQKDTSEETDEF